MHVTKILNYLVVLPCALAAAVQMEACADNAVKPAQQSNQSGKSTLPNKTTAAPKPSGIKKPAQAPAKVSSTAKPTAGKAKPAGTAPGKPPASTRTGKPPASRKTGKAPAVKAPAIVTADGKPIWLDLKAARLASKTKSRPVLADFYTDWCGWCKYMDRTTFRDQKVQAYLAQNFVCAKLNAQDGGDGEELAQKYGITGFPTYMVFDAHGKALGQIVGYQDADQFLKSVEKARTFHPVAAANHP
jgi:thiol-disulfide isomerase/thioredoxin